MVSRDSPGRGEFPPPSFLVWIGGLLLLGSFWLLVRAFPGFEPLIGGQLPDGVIGIGGGSGRTPVLVVFLGLVAAVSAVFTTIGSFGNVRPTTRPFLLGLASWLSVAAYLLFAESASLRAGALAAAFLTAVASVALGSASRVPAGKPRAHLSSLRSPR